jgi:endonuclease/exonuclease/phosphatase family metal-dependent hydrolase
MCAIVRAWNFTILSGSEATYPADEPQDCLDYVALFKGHSVETLESSVIEEPEASDHRPVVVRMTFL